MRWVGLVSYYLVTKYFWCHLSVNSNDKFVSGLQWPKQIFELFMLYLKYTSKRLNRSSSQKVYKGLNCF